ncbi:hypothetical protein BDV95DRAFT_458042, partial [Massariosphaeria phaeospora]
QPAFSSLPLELFLNVLDQLVGTPTSQRPIALPPTHSTTRTLRALTLVSRDIYPIASRYLYTHSLYLDTCQRYTLFRRTLALPLGNQHPLALPYNTPTRNEPLFAAADLPRHITALFVSPQKLLAAGAAPMVRLPQVIDLCARVGSSLRRLALDLQPVYSSYSEARAFKPHVADNQIFLGMPRLEELVCSYDTMDYFVLPPPRLKRLAVTSQGLNAVQQRFCFAVASLEVLVFIQGVDMEAAHIDMLFEAYHGRHLDVVMVELEANHRCPVGMREWTDEDRVTVWEADVGYRSDEDDLLLCDNWIWANGVAGTLWGCEKRRKGASRESQMQL